jgi:pilus assembly protein CpaF
MRDENTAMQRDGSSSDGVDTTAQLAERLRPMNSAEQESMDLIYPRLLKVMDLPQLVRLDTRDAKRQVNDVCERLMQETHLPLSLVSRRRLAQRIEDEILGLGPIEPLLADRRISDILVNGPNRVYVERHGKLELTEVRFGSNSHLMNIIDRIVSAVGRRIDESSPMVDARLKDGSRVNVIIPPLALDGPVLSIRRFAVELLTIDDLIKLNTLTASVAEVLNAIVRARLNVLISGGTGSGKTTLLNLLSGFIPETERIVTIEDSAELQLHQPHVVRLETRPPNIEGRGAVTQRDLVRNSLRMRPDRIIIGEVRGAEALDMLQAMNTGHDGSLTTVHANSPRDALSRVENMVSMSGISFPIPALRAQISSALDILIHIERQEDGRRRLVSLQEIDGLETDIITTAEIFTFKRRGVDSNGGVLGTLEATGVMPAFMTRLQERGITVPVNVFHQPAAIPAEM